MLTRCTGMMNHAWDGSHSKATSLFTGANEASAATHSESECCRGGGASEEPELKTQGNWRSPFPSSAQRSKSTKPLHQDILTLLPNDLRAALQLPRLKFSNGL